MLRTNFSNRYGTLTLELVSSVGPLAGLRSEHVADEHKFSLDTAEQIALITENRGIQMFGPWKSLEDRLCIVVHDSPSTVAVARIASMNYIGPNAQQEVATLARCATHIFAQW